MYSHNSNVGAGCIAAAWLIVSGLSLNSAHAWLTIDFEDPVLPASTARPATSTDQSPYVSHEVVFNRTWSTEFDCCPGGWAHSNQADQTTPGYTNAYSAVSSATGGGGYQSSQFAVSNNLQKGEATIGFPGPVEIQGMYLTNTTYTYQAVVNGDDGAGFVKGPFTAGDWLRLDVIGLDASDNETGRAALYLADYRDGAAMALDGWTWLNLTGLGQNVRAVEFEMESTDSGPFGMNTPAYFAVDDLTFRLVPEPGSTCALIGAIVIAGRAISRRRRSLMAASSKCDEL